MRVIKKVRTRQFVLAASISAMLGAAAAPALAADQDLLDKLTEKGVLTEEEANELRDSNELTGSSKGKFEWKSEDGDSSIQLRGRVQLDYYSFDHDGQEEGFDIRRVYFGAQGKLYKNWSYAAIYNFDGNDLEYAYLDYKWTDAARLRIGALKYQYSFEEYTSSRFLDFMERSFVNVGVMFYGQSGKNVLSYSLGVLNGCGKNCTQDDPKADGLDYTGRLAANFAPLMNWENGVLHIGGAYQTGDQPRDDPANQGTEARGLTFFNGTGPTSGDKMERTRTQLEGVVIFGPIKLQGETVRENLSADGGFDRDIDAAYVSVNWLITGEKYIDNYSINGMGGIKPNKSIENGGRGAWEVGVRFSQFEADNQYVVSTTSTNKADAFTAGLKWILNEHVRFMLDYVKTDFDTPIMAGTEMVNSEKAVNLRSAIHF